MTKKTDTNNHSIILYITNSKTKYMQNKKNEIVKTCQDLWNDKKIDIKTVDYDDPEGEGDVPNNFIKENADFVIFLIDDSYDEKRLKLYKEKIKTAVDSYSNNFKPFVIVYLTKAAKGKLEKSNDGSRGKELNDLLNKEEQKIKVVIAETDSISATIKQDIELYEELYVNKWVQAARKTIRKKRILAWIIPITLFILAVVFALPFINQYQTEKQPRLLLVGGGSAKNYIRDECGIDVISYYPKYWIYAPMPSSNSWTLLTEEAMKNDEHRKYYPICLSAEEADDTVFLGNMEPTVFKEKGVVVSLLIGYDTLKAYCNFSYINRKFLDDILKQSCRKLKLKNQDNQDSTMITYFDSISRTKTIGCETLNAFIQKDKSIKLYTTSLRSGTRNAYIDPTKANLQFLTEEYDPNNHKIELYTDNSTIDSSLNFIILGSKHYKPYHGISEAKALTVLDKNGNQIIKPIYLYFMAYNTNEKYEIKEEISNFLDKIGKSLSEDQINKIKKSKSFIVKINLSDDKK